MKPIQLTITLIFTAAILVACSEKASDRVMKESVSAETPMYDSLLAKQLGADDYGMKSYVMAFLKSGPNKSENVEQAQSLQRAHLDNINRLAEEGILVAAGPFLDQGELRGIYIFDVATIAEAAQLTSTDPAIAAGVLSMELHPWYGSAALLQLNDWHKRIAKIPI